MVVGIYHEAKKQITDVMTPVKTIKKFKKYP
jgi:hypothetical protein